MAIQAIPENSKKCRYYLHLIMASETECRGKERRHMVFGGVQAACCGLEAQTHHSWLLEVHGSYRQAIASLITQIQPGQLHFGGL